MEPTRDKPTPTIITIGQGTNQEEERLAPTTISIGQPKPEPVVVVTATPIQIAPAKPFVVTTPTSIAGTTRVRIQVTHADLLHAYPKIQPPVRDKALDLILQFHIEEAKTNEFILWGQTLQEEYSRLTHQFVLIGTTETKTNAIRHITRLHEIMMSLQQPDSPEQGNTWLKLFSKKETASSEDFQATQAEVLQLVELLSLVISPLTELHGKVEKLRDEFKKLRDDIESYAIAAEVLVNYMTTQSLRTELREVLHGRVIALYGTVASIMQNAALQSTRGSDTLTLISCIQNTVLNSIPTWLTTYVEILRKQCLGESSTTTVIEESKRMMSRIIENLKFS